MIIKRTTFLRCCKWWAQNAGKMLKISSLWASELNYRVEESFSTPAVGELTQKWTRIDVQVHTSESSHLIIVVANWAACCSVFRVLRDTGRLWVSQWKGGKFRVEKRKKMTELLIFETMGFNMRRSSSHLLIMTMWECELKEAKWMLESTTTEGNMWKLNKLDDCRLHRNLILS